MQTTKHQAKDRQNTDKNSAKKFYNSKSPAPTTNTVTDLVAGVFATILILITLLHMDPANAMAVIMCR